MMKKILLDLNVVIDYLDESRLRHKTVRKCLNHLKDKVKFLFSSYQYDTLNYILRRIYKSSEKVHSKIFSFIDEFKVNIIATSGKNALEADQYKDLEDGMLLSIKNRIGNDCFILTYDKYLLSFDNVYKPEDLVLEEDKKSISLLDLQLEYYSFAEQLEESLLKTAGKAKYILGPEVSELEQKIASYIGTKHAIGVSSGTDACAIFKGFGYKK